MTDEPMREKLERTLAFFFSANKQPDMSGDPRKRCSPLQLRDLRDAVSALQDAFPVLRDTWPDEAAALRALDDWFSESGGWDGMRSEGVDEEWYVKSMISALRAAIQSPGEGETHG